ncbi:uncharacterized protein VTP21DRAFT_9849 [Calcarisporiella thermophila]|uniref:uncharacterized protein n=1 Tax=Calcarisporiella thermophila TaxID=911321 RepID=UPI0037434DDE
MSEINRYLTSIRSRLQQPESNVTAVVCVGNESADLDSMISSLGFAYLSSRFPDCSCSAISEALYIPVVSIPRADVLLRPECVHVLQPYLQSLFTLDDLGLIPSNPYTVLLDHNRDNNIINGRVVGILDHHVDEGLYLDVSLRRIEMVGSCVTLVVLQFLERWKMQMDNEWSKELAKLMLAPLLVDTVNLEPKFGRATSLDQQAADFLFSILLGSAPMEEKKLVAIDTYSDLQKARLKVDHLSTWDLLRKDYKQWDVEGVGISSVSWDLTAWTLRDGCESVVTSIESYAFSRHLRLYLAMTACEKDGVFQRELVVFPIESEMDGVLERLEEKAELDLTSEGYEELNQAAQQVMTGKTGRMKFYRQRNIKTSRKQLWPLVQSLIQSGI